MNQWVYLIKNLLRQYIFMSPRWYTEEAWELHKLNQAVFRACSVLLPDYGKSTEQKIPTEQFTHTMKGKQNL